MENKNSNLRNKVKISPIERKLKGLDLKDRSLVNRRKAKASKETSIEKNITQKPGDKFEPHIATGIHSLKSKNAFDISSLSSHLSNIGLDTQEDDFDLLDLYASHIIELLNEGVYIFANLTKHERFILFRYFYKTNPVLGRIMDIHTEIPISKLRLQAPKNCPEIVKDYIVQYYEKIFEGLNLTEVLRDLALHYWVYGEAYCLVDDYYKKFDRKLQDLRTIDEKIYVQSEEDMAFMEKVEDAYKEDPDSIGLSDRFKYLDKKFGGFFVKGYTGPDRIRVLKFYNIMEYYHNEDIDFEAIRVQISNGLKELVDEGTTEEDLLEMGYTPGYLDLISNPENTSSNSVLIENNTNSGEPFIFIFKRYESTSVMQRVFEACLGWENSKRALKAKINQVGKLGRIVTSEGLGEEQTELLKIEVEQMLSDPNHAIVANYPIDWAEVNNFIKEELNELIQSTNDLKEEIAMGMGVPDSLISGDSQYSGDNIKLDILNNQYFSFKVMMQNLLEDNILKPIALRKGFISVDVWGSPALLYPKLTFSRVSLRSEDYFDLLFDLYQKNSLPISVIYEMLNLDVDDVTRAIQEDLFTLKDATFNDLVRDIYGQISDSIVSKTDLVEKIIEGLGLPRKKEEGIEQNMEDKDWGNA